MKRCTWCGIEKAQSEFYRKREGGKERSYSHCRKCHNAHVVKKKAADPDGKRKACEVTKRHYRRVGPIANRDAWLRSQYGITHADYEAMALSQGGACKICGKVPGRNRKGQTKLCVDHCHKTGKIRGLLCNACNRSVGQLGDTPEGVMRAVHYLRAEAEAYDPLPFIA